MWTKTGELCVEVSKNYNAQATGRGEEEAMEEGDGGGAGAYFMPTVAVAKFRQNKSLSRTLFAYTKQKARDGFKVGDEARGEKGV